MVAGRGPLRVPPATRPASNFNGQVAPSFLVTVRHYGRSGASSQSPDQRHTVHTISAQGHARCSHGVRRGHRITLDTESAPQPTHGIAGQGQGYVPLQSRCVLHLFGVPPST